MDYTNSISLFSNIIRRKDSISELGPSPIGSRSASPIASVVGDEAPQPRIAAKHKGNIDANASSHIFG